MGGRCLQHLSPNLFSSIAQLAPDCKPGCGRLRLRFGQLWQVAPPSFTPWSLWGLLPSGSSTMAVRPPQVVAYGLPLANTPQAVLQRYRAIARPGETCYTPRQEGYMLYSSATAATAAGISQATIRNLTSGRFAEYYAGLWSAGATPGKGAARVMQEDDVKLLAYVASRTRAGASHETVAAEVRAGSLARFTWPPPESPDQPQEPMNDVPIQPPAPEVLPPEQSATALVVLGQFTEALRIEFAAAREREATLQAALVDAEKRAAVAEAQLAALQVSRKHWWSRLLGG